MSAGSGGTWGSGALLSFGLGLSLALKSGLRALAVGAVLYPIVLTISRADGSDPSLASAMLRILAPLLFAGAVGSSLAAWRERGEWSGWMGLGLRPRSMVPPVLGLSLVAGGVIAWMGPSAGTAKESMALGAALELPSPLPQGEGRWPERIPGTKRYGWIDADRGIWQRSPADLSLAQLLDRLGKPAPLGARTGVDAAELLRRWGWAMAWVFAPLCGFGGLRSRGEQRLDSQLGAGVRAVLPLLAWLALVLGASSALTVLL